MSPILAVTTTASVVLVAAVLGLAWRARTGRLRTSAGDLTLAPGDLPGLHALASRATLVLFSTRYCARCPATSRLLAELARDRPGVAALTVDLTGDAETARRFSVLQTPTVLVLDATGRLVGRTGGAPRRDELAATLDTLAPQPGRRV